MKKTIITSAKLIIAVLIFLIIPIISIAQKLPKVQEASSKLPANLKIDGQATEWDNKFQAYNANTGVFYTIANDNDRLYMVIHATDAMVIRKIMAGSVTISINIPATNKTAQNVIVTYPVFDKKNRPNINIKSKPQSTKNETADTKQLDSFMYVVNKELENKSKEIKVFGIKGIDTSISIYNEDGIKTASRFDHQIAYTYELVIPLKYFGFNEQGKFAYTVKLNGSNNFEGVRVNDFPGGREMFWDGDKPTESDIQFMLYPTSFSGSYTLAEK
jgi:hypothetical protein